MHDTRGVGHGFEFSDTDTDQIRLFTEQLDSKIEALTEFYQDAIVVCSDIPKATPTIQYSEPIGPTQEFPYRLPSRSILNG